MRIVHFVESHTVHTGRLVTDQLNEGHHVKVVTFNDYVGSGPVEVVPSMMWATTLPYSHHWRSVLRVHKSIQAFDPEILHGHYLTTAALYLLGGRNRAVVASATGSDVLVDPAEAHARLLLRLLPRWVDVFTSPAPHVTDRMVSLGIPRWSIAPVFWGVDTVNYHPPASPSVEETIVSTRNHEHVYDLPTLLRALVSVRGEKPSVRAMVYGDGSYRGPLRRLANELGLAPNVTFMGLVEHTVLAKALRSARVYVSTSRSDGSSVSLLEAMATGLVPVVSDINGNRQWITHGENGLLFEAGNSGELAKAILRALDDEELRTRCFRSNPLVVRNSGSWGVSMEALRRAYAKAVERFDQSR